MTDTDFRQLCNTFGFAPSRALREMLDAATKQAVLTEREACIDLTDSRCQCGGLIQSRNRNA